MDTIAPFSVLLSVYYKNSPEQLFQSIKSIWTDQKLKPSQIVIVEDGVLTTELEQVVDYWFSQRPGIFTIVKLPQNVGLGAALDQGLKYCRYDLIARMDADDISLSDRFLEQFTYMVNHPDVDILGGQVEEWDEKMEKCLVKKRLPLTHDELSFFIKYRCPFNHPTTMYKKNVILSVGGYPCKRLEDYYLWINLLLNGRKFANLGSVLVKMRAGEMVKTRRGLSVLWPELQLQKYLFNSGVINLLELLINCLMRIVLRSLPYPLRVFVYRALR